MFIVDLDSSSRTFKSTIVDTDQHQICPSLVADWLTLNCVVGEARKRDGWSCHLHGIGPSQACESNDDGNGPASVQRVGHKANVTGGLHACESLCNERLGGRAEAGIFLSNIACLIAVYFLLDSQIACWSEVQRLSGH